MIPVATTRTYCWALWAGTREPARQVPQPAASVQAGVLVYMRVGIMKKMGEKKRPQRKEKKKREEMGRRLLIFSSD